VPIECTREILSAEVAHILREVRKKRGLSMTALAARAGLSQGMISLVENKLRNPTLDTLLRICEVLGIRLEEVIRRARRASRSGANPK
jgi:transcriptional regulator with XRE-family HTH domain